MDETNSSAFQLVPVSYVAPASSSVPRGQINRRYNIMGSMVDVPTAPMHTKGGSRFIPFKLVDQGSSLQGVKCSIFEQKSHPLPLTVLRSGHILVILNADQQYSGAWTAKMVTSSLIVANEDGEVIHRHPANLDATPFLSSIKALRDALPSKLALYVPELDNKETLKPVTLSFFVDPVSGPPSGPGTRHLALLVKVLEIKQYFKNVQLLVWDGTGHCNMTVLTRNLTHLRQTYPHGTISTFTVWGKHAFDILEAVVPGTWLDVSGFLFKILQGEVVFQSTDERFLWEIAPNDDPRVMALAQLEPIALLPPPPISNYPPTAAPSTAVAPAFPLTRCKPIASAYDSNSYNIEYLSTIAEIVANPPSKDEPKCWRVQAHIAAMLPQAPQSTQQLDPFIRVACMDCHTNPKLPSDTCPHTNVAPALLFSILLVGSDPSSPYIRVQISGQQALGLLQITTDDVATKSKDLLAAITAFAAEKAIHCHIVGELRGTNVEYLLFGSELAR